MTVTGNMPAALALRAVETSHFGVTLADAGQPDVPLVYANQAFTDMTGYHLDETQGQNCRFLQGPETDPDAVRAIRDAIAHGTPGTFLLLNYRKDGRRFWNRFQLSPVTDETGVVTAFLGMQVDITDDVDRVGRETERQKLETLGRMASGVAHELNNALQPVKLFAEMLCDDPGPDAETATRCARGILDGATIASDVVGQVLSFARRDGQADAVYDAQEVIGDAVEFAASYLPKEVLVDRRRFDTQRPVGDFKVQLNRTSLMQVVANLFKNAADAMDGPGTISVSVAQASADGFELAISDNGRGVASKDLKHIFEPFFTTKAPGKGTGLGLSTIYGIVEAWGGRISAESMVGIGTTFRIQIPVVERERGGHGDDLVN